MREEYNCSELNNSGAESKRDKNIILIGMPGVGKSTVGVILAKTLGMDFVDEDILICNCEHSTLPEIISEKGIDALLKIEEQVGLTFAGSNCVLATGGSAVFSDAAMQHLKSTGICIWLYSPLDVIEERLARGSRENRGVAAPASMTVEDIYNQRMPLYEKHADIKIVCTGQPESTVEKIIETLQRQA